MPPSRSGDTLEPLSRSRGGQVLLGTGLALALAAAGALVITEDLRWLRLAIVAALWAALVGAFLAAKYRGRLTDRDEHVQDLQAIYELELQREIAARREYELQVESEIRSQVERESRQDLAELRQELQALRQTLQGLLGGEVLVERYALHAQGTRMRPLAEERQLRHPQMKRLGAGRGEGTYEPVTERIERIVEAVRSPQPQPQPQPPPRPEGSSPVPRRGDRAERPPWPSPANHNRVMEPPPRIVEPSSLVDLPPAPPPPPRSVPPQRAVEITNVVDGHRAVELPPPPPVEQPRSVELPLPEPPRPPEPSRIVEPARSAWAERLFAPPPAAPRPHPAEVSDRWFMADAFQTELPPGAQPSGRHPQPNGAQTGGRRRRAEPEPPPPPEPPRRHARPEPDSGGGRRRRSEETPPPRQPDRPSGSHSQGNSVADLLATHGNATPRRRRRREE